MTNPTEKQLAMARRIADDICKNHTDFDPQNDPDDAAVWMAARNGALAAIIETTKLTQAFVKTEIVPIWDDSPEIDVECNNLVRRLIEDIGAFAHLPAEAGEGM